MKKVMIVEDESDVAELARLALESEDVTVTLAFDGLSALDEIPRVRPDLVLLDVMMPTVDGFDLCKRLKDDPDTEDIIVVLFTAANEPFIIERIVGVGADDYVMKPIDGTRLQHRIRTLLGLPKK
ncbi:MAG TPA: response regulator [Planctomycetota bacterium]|nr:response regulator [Planctomycetota bacterium]